MDQGQLSANGARIFVNATPLGILKGLVILLLLLEFPAVEPWYDPTKRISKKESRRESNQPKDLSPSANHQSGGAGWVRRT
jgi:hypothetical protein